MRIPDRLVVRRNTDAAAEDHPTWARHGWRSESREESKLAHDGLIAALDIGTTKVCCFVAEADQAGQVRVLGIGHHASSGIKGGMIVEMEAAERSIRRSEEHTSELQSLMRISYAVFCLKKKQPTHIKLIPLSTR